MYLHRGYTQIMYIGQEIQREYHMDLNCQEIIDYVIIYIDKPIKYLDSTGPKQSKHKIYIIINVEFIYF